MTLGSLFSGSGSFELAGALNGIVPVWASEVEPYPIAVSSSRFPNLDHLGSVTDVHGDQITPVDVLTFGSPCFPAGVQVLTDTGYAPIEDIRVGMKVLTHTGQWQEVTATGSKIASTMRLQGHHYGQETTPNHPIYSAEPANPCDGGLQNQGMWTPAGKMLGKYWAVPNAIASLAIPQLESLGKERASRFNMNEDFFYLVGRWIGDGWLRDSQRPGRPQGQTWGVVLICEAPDKADELITAVRKVVEPVAIEKTPTCVKVKIYSKPLVRWLFTHFGKYAHGKTLPGWVYGMPEAYRRALFNGLMDSDGYKVKESFIKLTTVSKKLAHGVRILAETLGYFTTIYFDPRPSQTVIEGRVANQRDTYTVGIRIPIHTSGVRCCSHTWYPVRKIIPTNELKRVYNLTVANDNSYVADGIVVHNCQDVSVAGKQAGLHEGKRSSLFYEAIRIIREMRCATHGQYPRFAVFENVPGLFSSAKGADFRAVLQAFIDLCDDTLLVPEPPKGRWLHAGEIVGDHFSLAWRVQGAEHWGVPQRRNRIYLVVDFTAGCAGEVLFEQPSLRGYPSPCRTPRQGAPADAARSTGRSAGFSSGQGVKAHGIGYEEEQSPTLRSQAGGNSIPCVLCQTPWDHQSKRIFDTEGIFPTLPAGEGGGQNDQAIVYDTTQITSPANWSNPQPGNPSHPLCARAHVPLLVEPTVCNESGQGYWMPGFGCLRAEGENRPSRPGHLVCFAQNQRDEVRDLGKQAGALAANPGMKQQSYLAYALQGNGIDRSETAGCNGCGWKANVSYTLNTIDRHAVCYQDTVGALCAADWRGPNSQYVGSDKLVVDPLCTDARGNGEGNVCSTITGDHENRITDYTNIVTYGGDKAGTLDASYYKGAGARNGKEREFIAEHHSGRKYIVRRLSTTECARLQGLPDCWAIPIHKDSMTDKEAAFWEKIRETQCAIKGTRYKPFAKREQLVGWYNRLRTDSAEYKLYGNGIALPCAAYVLRGIALVLQNGKITEEDRDHVC